MTHFLAYLQAIFGVGAAFGFVLGSFSFAVIVVIGNDRRMPEWMQRSTAILFIVSFGLIAADGSIAFTHWLLVSAG